MPAPSNETVEPKLTVKLETTTLPDAGGVAQGGNPAGRGGTVKLI